METPTASAYTFWEFDCDACGGTTRVDHDPSAETIPCDDCDAPTYIEGVR